MIWRCLRSTITGTPFTLAQEYSISGTSESTTVTACDEAIALLREIADLQTDDDGDVIVGAIANGHNDQLSRITLFLADYDL